MTNIAPPPPPPPPAQPPAPPTKSKGRGPAIIAIAAGLVIVVGIVIGSAIVGLRGASQPVVAGSQSQAAAPSVQPAPSSDPTETATAFDPDESDFLIDIKVLKKECFGSAGCNITFRIKPMYVGVDDLPDVGQIEVSYKIKGGEEPLENTFTVDSDGTAHFDSEELIGTKSSHSKLKAVVTDVEYDPSA